MAAQTEFFPPPFVLTRERERERAREFGHVQRRFDSRVNSMMATLLPGDYFVAIEGEMISTVLRRHESLHASDR